MGIGQSVHKNLGWKGQHERVKRWHERVRQIGFGNGSSDREHDHDVVYAFFQNSYHLRDWLKHSKAIPQSKLDEFFKSNIEMQVCQDICNGTKHYKLDKPKVDSQFSIGREYVPKNWPSTRREKWFIICGSEKYDIFDLADRCMALWDEFIETMKAPTPSKETLW